MKLVSHLGLLAFLASGIPACVAFSNPQAAKTHHQQQQQSNNINSNKNEVALQQQQSSLPSRRELFQKTASSIVGVTGALVLPGFATVEPANASGGATAGKYTTIPIAKRRYYGRVQA